MRKVIMAMVCATAMTGFISDARASGGTETIKVSKCFSTFSDVWSQLLIKASSTNGSAHLYAYLPSGAYLGEVQNGSGGRYGGTVFGTYSNPAYILIVSSTGASVVAPTTPFQL